MTQARGLAASVCLAITLAAASPAADAKVFKNRDGSCQVDIPADWVSESVGLGAHSPDKTVAVTVSSPKRFDSFEQLKEKVKTNFPKSTVTSETSTEFVMEGKSLVGMPDVYRAIPAGTGKFCIVDVTYKNGDPTLARTVAASLQAGP